MVVSSSPAGQLANTAGTSINNNFKSTDNLDQKYPLRSGREQSELPFICESCESLRGECWVWA